MTESIKKALLCTAVAALLLTAACTGMTGEAKNTQKPSASPTANATDAPSASPLSTEQPSPEATGGASASPNGTEALGTETALSGLGEGFSEGMVVDPDDVPELTSLLKEHEAYADMTIQSITYKLYEGRRAYYVVLQGEGEASHPIYVFADGSTVDGAE